jgi:transposase
MHIIIRDRQDLQCLRDSIRKEGNAKQRDRYRAVLLALEGHLTKTIMHMLDRSKNFVQRWAYAYRDHGIDALAPKSPTGRPSKLTESQEKQFRQRMLDGPTHDDGVCSLRGKDARRIMEREFGVHYSLPGVYDLLHRLGLSCLQPRAKHRKNDPQKMQAWLEQAPLLSKNADKSTPTEP